MIESTLEQNINNLYEADFPAQNNYELIKPLFNGLKENIFGYKKYFVTLQERYSVANDCIEEIKRYKQHNKLTVTRSIVEDLNDELLDLSLHKNNAYVKKLIQKEKLSKETINELYDNLLDYRDDSFSKVYGLDEKIIKEESSNISDLKKIIDGDLKTVEETNGETKSMYFWKNKLEYIKEELSEVKLEEISLHDLDTIKYLIKKVSKSNYLKKKVEENRETFTLKTEALYELRKVYDEGFEFLAKRQEIKQTPKTNRLKKRLKTTFFDMFNTSKKRYSNTLNANAE